MKEEDIHKKDWQLMVNLCKCRLLSITFTNDLSDLNTSLLKFTIHSK